MTRYRSGTREIFILENYFRREITELKLFAYTIISHWRLISGPREEWGEGVTVILPADAEG